MVRLAELLQRTARRERAACVVPTARGLVVRNVLRLQALRQDVDHFATHVDHEHGHRILGHCSLRLLRQRHGSGARCLPRGQVERLGFGGRQHVSAARS